MPAKYDRGEDWARKLKMRSTGMFSTPSYWGVGEPFDDSRSGGNPRAMGVQFSTNVQRKGLTGGNWGSTDGGHNRIKRLYEGEVYKDPGMNERKWNMEQRKKDLTPEGFRYPSMPQDSSGLGGNWGRIGPKLKHEAETEGKRDGREVREAATLKQGTKPFKLNPPKKGYGSSTPGLLFGPGPGKDGNGGGLGKGYEWIKDEYDLPREAVKAERHHQMELLKGRAPYRTMGRSIDFFDGHFDRSGRVAAPKSITEDPVIPAPEVVKEEPRESIHGKPFYPARAPSSGKFCFNKCPEYLEDPEEARYKAAQEEALKMRNVAEKPFKPSGTKSSRPARTIEFYEPGIRMGS